MSMPRWPDRRQSCQENQVMSTTGLTRVGIRAARSSHSRSARQAGRAEVRSEYLDSSAHNPNGRAPKRSYKAVMPAARAKRQVHAASWRTDVSREALVHILHARQLGGSVEGVACRGRAGRGQRCVCVLHGTRSKGFRGRYGCRAIVMAEAAGQLAATLSHPPGTLQRQSG